MVDGTTRREFLWSLGYGVVGAAVAQGIVSSGADASEPAGQSTKKYEPLTDRKLRVGIVGYGFCKFGAAFGFQDHPNVEVVAVSDLFPDRCSALAAACRCKETYPSLEELVKDDRIEAVFVATDAPSHARHAITVMEHGKHVAVAVPAVWGSLEDADRLLETVKKTGLKYAMFETSTFRPDCYAMRQIYRAGGFGRIVYAEGEYFHYLPHGLPSYKGWRDGSPPLWYPTHSTAYYVSVTGGSFTSVSCIGFKAGFPLYRPGANRYGNEFTDEIGLFETSEGGTARMMMAKSVQGYHAETGRVYGEKGSFYAGRYHGTLKELPDISRPPLPPSVPPGGHGGSHGHLMHDFVMAVLLDRKPIVDVVDALNMTVPGIIAHQSALRDGERLRIPQYSL